MVAHSWNPIKRWLEWHRISRHIVAPIWSRLPEKWRWATIYKLNRSKRFCWADLASAAINDFEDDPCDRHLPLPDKTRTAQCNTCEWGNCTHEGQCSCWCGKFQFQTDRGKSGLVQR